jgi:hypothetical protein
MLSAAMRSDAVASRQEEQSRDAKIGRRGDCLRTQAVTKPSLPRMPARERMRVFIRTSRSTRSSPISRRAALSAHGHRWRSSCVLLSHELRCAAGADFGVAEVHADRLNRAGRQAVRRCRSHRPSRRPIERSNLFPVGRTAALSRGGSRLPLARGDSEVDPPWGRHPRTDCRIHRRMQRSGDVRRDRWSSSDPGGTRGPTSVPAFLAEQQRAGYQADAVAASVARLKFVDGRCGAGSRRRFWSRQTVDSGRYSHR